MFIFSIFTGSYDLSVHWEKHVMSEQKIFKLGNFPYFPLSYRKSFRKYYWPEKHPFVDVRRKFRWNYSFLKKFKWNSLILQWCHGILQKLFYYWFILFVLNKNKMGEFKPISGQFSISIPPENIFWGHKNGTWPDMGQIVDLHL